MARTPEKLELGDVTITVTPLPYQKSEDILPDVMIVVSHVMQEVVDTDLIGKLKEIKAKADVIKLLPMLAPIMRVLGERLGEGKLKQLVPLVLATTKAEFLDDQGQKERRELMNLKDRAIFFDAHPELYLVTLFFAGKVTFGRFFSVAALLKVKEPPAAES